jgi:hypothetical protein
MDSILPHRDGASTRPGAVHLTAWHGWLLISVLVAAYMVSRGIAKAGLYDPYTATRDDD